MRGVSAHGGRRPPSDGDGDRLEVERVQLFCMYMCK